MDNSSQELKPVAELSYDQAVQELEAILAELEQSKVNVDFLAQRVGRGSELIKFCKSRLEAVTNDVDSIVETLVEEIPSE
jgi:exodeoxyribonuclease VII small subunit